MDEETVGKVEQHLEQISSENNIQLDKVIVFGSRARDDYREKSDIDLILISEDFQDTPSAQRPRPYYLNWNYDDLPEPEIICYTPEEFEDKKENTGFIAHTAAQEGLEI